VFIAPVDVISYYGRQNSQGAFAYYPRATRFKIKADKHIGEIAYQLLTVALKLKRHIKAEQRAPKRRRPP